MINYAEFETNHPEFKNTERFVNWYNRTALDEYAINDNTDLEYTLNLVVDDWHMRGCSYNSYELKAHDTKLGCTDDFSFDVETTHNEGDDTYEYTFMF